MICQGEGNSFLHVADDLWRGGTTEFLDNKLNLNRNEILQYFARNELKY